MRKSVLKRTLSIVLACVMLMSIFFVVPMQAGATDRKKIQNLSWTLNTSKVYYNDGKAPTWTYMIKDGKTILAEDKDYTITYSRKSVGHCVATFRGKGYYQGSRTVNFVILPRPLKLCSVTMNGTKTPYNGTHQYPTITVKCGKTKLVNGKDYTISYSTNTKLPGKVYVYVKGKGNYSGTVTKSFTIYVKKPAGSAKFTKINENKIKIDWSGVTCDGYELQRYYGGKWVSVASVKDSVYTAPYAPKYRIRAYVNHPGSSKKSYSEWAVHSYFRV